MCFLFHCLSQLVALFNKNLSRKIFSKLSLTGLLSRIFLSACGPVRVHYKATTKGEEKKHNPCTTKFYKRKTKQALKKMNEEKLKMMRSPLIFQLKKSFFFSFSWCSNPFICSNTVFFLLLFFLLTKACTYFGYGLHTSALAVSSTFVFN